MMEEASFLCGSGLQPGVREDILGGEDSRKDFNINQNETQELLEP
jgi:hypothetical protein